MICISCDKDKKTEVSANDIAFQECLVFFYMMRKLRHYNALKNNCFENK